MTTSAEFRSAFLAKTTRPTAGHGGSRSTRLNPSSATPRNILNCRVRMLDGTDLDFQLPVGIIVRKKIWYKFLLQKLVLPQRRIFAWGQNFGAILRTCSSSSLVMQILPKVPLGNVQKETVIMCLFFHPNKKSIRVPIN